MEHFYWYWYIIRCFFFYIFTISPKTGSKNTGTCFLGRKKNPVGLRRHSDLCLCSIPNATPKMMPPTISTHWNPPNPSKYQKINFFIQNGSKTNQKPIFNSHSPKIIKPKMLPPNCLTHYLSTISLFPSKNIDSKGICQKIPKSKNSVLIIPYVCIFGYLLGD